MTPEELQTLMELCGVPQQPRGANAAQRLHYGLASVKGAHFTEARAVPSSLAAVARHELPWDGEKLGTRAARLSCFAPAGAPLSVIRQVAADATRELRSAGYGYAFVRLESDDVRALHAFEEAGFRTVDILLTQYMEAKAAGPFQAPDGIVVRRADLNDTEALGRLSDDAFTMSRFHSDPRVGLERARPIYREWIANGLRGLHELTVVATDAASGAIAGFIACKEVSPIEASFGYKQCRLDLVAVAAPFRGRNVLRAMLDLVLEEASSRSWRVLSVGTQASNIRAIRAYSRLGFAPGDALVTLRWWVDEAVSPSS